MLVVSDTSPIVALTHLGLVSILGELYREVLIPPAVARELQSPTRVRQAIDVSKLCIAGIRAPRDAARVRELADRLDPGEAEAIALAIELNADAILVDEARGRRIAAEMGIAVTGTLGVLVDAKQAGLVESVGSLMDRLEQELHFFISDGLRAVVLRRANEEQT